MSPFTHNKRHWQTLLTIMRRGWPANCLWCQLPTAEPAPLCGVCHDLLPYQRHVCQSCAHPLPESALTQHCGRCLANPDPRVNTRCTFEYDPPVTTLINNFKFKGHMAAGYTLARLMGYDLTQNLATKPDLVIPVPLHWSRLMQRGFNQSILLARTVARMLKCPFTHALCRRRRATISQRRLSAAQRRTQLKTAFIVTEPLEKTHVAIVDDIYTTGGTTRALAHSLLSHGAARIDIWCVARAHM